MEKDKCQALTHNCGSKRCGSLELKHGSGHVLCVSKVPIFNHLEEHQMVEVTETIKTRSYKKGEVIFSAGEQSDSLYIVRSGRVRVYRLSESGKEQLVRILDPGDFTGELALFSESVHESYAEAVKDTEICSITRADLQKFLLKYPSISLKILEEFSNRLEKTETRATRLSTEKVDTRLALFIVDGIGKDNPSKEFVLPMSKKDLSSYLGTTPETISRKLAEFEEAGYIRQKANRKIEVLDLDGLLML